jgi:pimeloyl-ACP methyl ester carboxylesterase
MNFLGIPKAHILGISMGGYIAQELAINHPDKVNGLILGCTSCGGHRAVFMSEERREKFTANKGLTPEQILGSDMDRISPIGLSGSILSDRRICEYFATYYQPLTPDN